MGIAVVVLFVIAAINNMAYGLLGAIWVAEQTISVQAQALEPFPDLTEPDNAFVPYLPEGISEAHVARMGGVYAQHLEMSDLVERARRAVVGRAEALLAAEPSSAVDRIVLDLPCTFFMLRCTRYFLKFSKEETCIHNPASLSFPEKKILQDILIITLL